MSLYLATDSELESIANAIRTKTGGSSDFVFPSGFVSAIASIASNCNVTASQMLNGKTAFTSSGKVTGTIPSKAAATYNISTSDQIIAASQYLSGAQTIRGVTTENISAGNIKEGIVVTVGDSNSATRIENVMGTCIPASLPGQSFMPFMWRNGDGVIPAFIYNKESSGSTAEKTAGYRVYWPANRAQGNHRFRLPCDITFTYFTSNSATSSKTLNLSGGTTYRFYQNDPDDQTKGKFRQDDGTDIANVYKIVSWEVT